MKCDGETQQRLHKVLRCEIKDWEKRTLIKGAILTYHFHVPSIRGDSLYVCLDMPAVKIPDERKIHLSNDTLGQIPSEIMGRIRHLCDQNQVELDVIDYEFNLMENRTWELYRNAPIEEIIRFASIGTEIAIQILDMTESHEQPWTTYEQLAGSILLQLKKELGAEYFWLREAFHFVCNPLLLNDSHLWTLASP